MKKYNVLASVFGLIFVLGMVVAPLVTLADPFDSSGSDSCVSLQYNMRYKSTDAKTNGEISALQDFLQSQNYLSTDPTGYFDQATRGAVKAFQNANGLSPDGKVGPITRAKINSLTCDTASTTPPTTPTLSTTPTVIASGGGSGSGSGLPIGCDPGFKFSSITGQACNGPVSVPTANTLVISGISGPQQLNIGQQGT